MARSFFDKLFHALLERLSQLSRRYVLKESKSKKLRAIIQDVPNLKDGLMLMEKLAPQRSDTDAKTKGPEKSTAINSA